MDDETPDERTRRVIREHGLPPGLLPAGITEAEILEDGTFTVHLDRQVERRHGDYPVRYRRCIRGVLGDGHVRELEGVQARQGLWFTVRRIDAGDGALTFHVGPVTRRLEVDAFPFP